MNGLCDPGAFTTDIQVELQREFKQMAGTSEKESPELLS